MTPSKTTSSVQRARAAKRLPPAGRPKSSAPARPGKAPPARDAATAALERAIGPLPRTTAKIVATEDRWQVPTYSKFPIAVVRGKGCYVFDADGRRYLDLYGGHAVALPGHCHPRVVAAIRAQAERLLFYSNVV